MKACPSRQDLCLVAPWWPQPWLWKLWDLFQKCCFVLGLLTSLDHFNFSTFSTTPEFPKLFGRQSRVKITTYIVCMRCEEMKHWPIPCRFPPASLTKSDHFLFHIAQEPIVPGPPPSGSLAWAWLNHRSLGFIHSWSSCLLCRGACGLNVFLSLKRAGVWYFVRWRMARCKCCWGKSFEVGTDPNTMKAIMERFAQPVRLEEITLVYLARVPGRPLAEW